MHRAPWPLVTPHTFAPRSCPPYHRSVLARSRGCAPRWRIAPCHHRQGAAAWPWPCVTAPQGTAWPQPRCHPSIGFSPWSPASRLRKAAKKPNAKYRPEPEAASRARQCKGLSASTGSAPPLAPSTLPGACDGSGRRKRHDFWVHGRPGVAGLVARAPGAHGTLAESIAASSPPLAHRDCSRRRLIAVTRCDPPAGLPPAGDHLPVSLTPLAS